MTTTKNKYNRVLSMEHNTNYQTKFIERRYRKSSPILEWGGEDEELVESFIQNKFILPVTYKFINAFLLLFSYPCDDNQWTEIANELLTQFR